MANAQHARSMAFEQGKECKDCGQRKPLSEYYAHTKMRDGVLNSCKECVKTRVKRRARTDPKVQAYERARAKTEKRRALRASVMQRWREENPHAYAAQTAVGNAVRAGKLNKEPCLFCGETRVHAHHRDYSKPLDVIWLCPKCHHRLHANFPETEGNNKGEAL